MGTTTFTFTFAVLCLVEQVRVNVLAEVILVITSFPPSLFLLPDQSPVAVQESALVTVHERVVELPFFTDVGLAVRLTVGVRSVQDWLVNEPERPVAA